MDNSRQFPLHLSDGTPLLAVARRVSINATGDVPAVELSLELEEVSARLLTEAALFPSIVLPDTTPLEPITLYLDVAAKTSVCRTFADAFRAGSDPVAVLFDGPGTTSTSLSPFHVLSNYTLQAWEVEQSQLVPDDVLAQYKEAPHSIMTQEETHPTISEAMRTFFEEESWPFTEVDATTLRLGFQGENGQWACYAQALEDFDQFAFFSMYPAAIDEEQRVAVALFLTRANYRMTIGNFEMNVDTGEIRFKTSIDVEDDRISSALIRSLVYANVFAMDRYLPGIAHVAAGTASPAEAIAEIEASG